MHVTFRLTAFIWVVSYLSISRADDFNSSENQTSVPYRGYLFFEIHTANERYAGTDSNIYVSVVGTKRNLTRHALKSLGPTMNAFERNQIDVCMIYTNVKFDETENVIRGIELINDGKWSGSSWKPSCIYLSTIDRAQTNDRWISSDNPVFISFSGSNKTVCY
ncbi:unnamed protein product [Adineta ricciae]|uniref:PLAT domain-containing protein n=1 Tax=Adineta ricciae TaxID=249248 RepID=A0A813QFZ2_ADIRI|nr:unnamed protein product [Adineta ricciae]CAF1204756.1 unnamed protein product [Adineta ricciae]